MHLIKTILLILSLVSLAACKGGQKNNNSSDELLREKAMAMSAGFAKAKFSHADIRTGNNGTLIISDAGGLLMTVKTEYRIDPEKIFTGDLDANGENDALVTITCLKDGFTESFEHLVFTASDGILNFNRALESNMTVFGIRDGVITAEVHTHPPSSPLYDCEACKEVVSFRFEKGDLIRIDPQD